ncbi:MULTISPECIES: hypothetical protein [Flavobacterium]|uniref:SMI1/KNR4 family protein n=1 Tax=Flavobacterium columnare TaxID=996 RepID=A0A0X8C3J3_9FLAO|nr:MULTISPECIES: hypothetical protein [Flavobacterium]AMA50414.1 hypothetical protein AWN65_13570 [Flavobacterium covae]AMA50420.1 hypothetical protein AWN65_13605 [Flavobacterium covae]MCJ1810331.1 hypothetical protein [Flavobacterium covae]QYS91869.1 hypothetical protein JJC04_04125 [Flavobacterium covae]RVU91035.1 hypothetical protein EH230_09070 [Flavobacterium columnare]
MLSEKILKYLKKNADLTSKEFQIKHEQNLKKLGFNDEINSSFLDFMIKYSDEYSGKEGFIMDVANDLIDFENSITQHLRNQDNLNSKYFSLYNLELDDYLLYNIEDDSVKLIEAKNMKQLSNDDYYDKKWNTFNEFLEYFFKLN